MKKLTVALWSLLLFLGIGATAFAQDTEEPELTPEISLLPMRGDTVGKNVTVKLTVSTGLVSDEGISFPAEMMYKTVVYYTTDGTTEPSEEAYKDQTDKENGTIKMVENIWDDEEEEYIVDENSMAYISLTFDREVHFMARAYYTMETNLGSVPAKTALYDRELKIKSEVNPAFLAGGAEAASGKVFTVGDKLVIKNPGSEEKMSEMYFSFDGTKPTRQAYDAQPDTKYAQWSVFKMNDREAEDVEITFCKDEQGFYAHIPEVMGYVTAADTVRIEDGQFQVMAWCESFILEDNDNDNDDRFEVMPTMPFSYGSDFVTVAYTVKDEEDPEVEPVATPTFSVKAGEVEEGTKVSIACETEGAVIYYTVDGAEPTAESTEYKEAITIDKAMTVKAIAVKGEAKSEVAVAAYTVKTANEDEELAGVSVYPNPSNGLFNIELPVAATIEVFASNGVLTQRISANAGVATLNIDRSGIYFIRIAGEGRAAIKRVVVR